MFESLREKKEEALGSKFQYQYINDKYLIFN